MLLLDSSFEFRGIKSERQEREKKLVCGLRFQGEFSRNLEAERLQVVECNENKGKKEKKIKR